MNNLKEILNQDIDLKERLKQICLILFNEEVSIYQVEEFHVITYEVHFNDNNFYEIDFSKGITTVELYNRIQNDLINERKLDLDINNPVINRNNIRYYNKSGI